MMLLVNTNANKPILHNVKLAFLFLITPLPRTLVLFLLWPVNFLLSPRLTRGGTRLVTQHPALVSLATRRP